MKYSLRSVIPVRRHKNSRAWAIFNQLNLRLIFPLTTVTYVCLYSLRFRLTPKWQVERCCRDQTVWFPWCLICVSCQFGCCVCVLFIQRKPKRNSSPPGRDLHLAPQHMAELLAQLSASCPGNRFRADGKDEQRSGLERKTRLLVGRGGIPHSRHKPTPWKVQDCNYQLL